LTDVSVPNVGKVQTAYTDKMRKCAELSPEVQQQWPVEAVYILSVALSVFVSRATGLNGFAVRDHLKYKLHSQKVTAQLSST
jgi:hypothetical protein